MIQNKLKTALTNRTNSFGAWIQIGHAACAEVFGRIGFDWVCVDLEHGAIELETMTGIFRALGAFDSVPVARVPANDPIWIHRALDCGALGLIVPMINTPDEAASAVREAKYPPAGKRGFGYSRANMHGVDFASYAASANDSIPVIVQIEHIDAIEHLDKILDVEGVDAAFIGPYDLTGSMGITGQMDHPDFLAVLQRFKDACKKHGRSAGMHIVKPNKHNIDSAIADGYNMIALGVDAILLYETALEVLSQARESHTRHALPGKNKADLPATEKHRTSNIEH